MVIRATDSIPFVTLPTEKSSDTLFAMVSFRSVEIPGLVVWDKFGNVLLATPLMGGEPLATADTALAKLDAVLQPAAKAN